MDFDGSLACIDFDGVNYELTWLRRSRYGLGKVGALRYCKWRICIMRMERLRLCLDVFPEQMAACSDLNTTAFLERMIHAEKPDLIVFTGDNIFASDSTDAAKSLDAAFAPAISSDIPWAAVLGNHDQESALSREGAVFTGHDHLNDFCGELTGIQLCYAGGFGYHAYGKAGWARRARVVVVNLEKMEKGGWGAVKSIETRKRLDDQHLTAIDSQVLWSKSSAGTP
ncbi:hypothetical protein SO802_016226 [Lithocarpus litseifolius]|uniref:Calcineurin-like phosphoesterase domain-containing protein n=1 Tax=Lithocarpus litseifolius TaxID=425828 RepID=A0AAW2CVW8_9ROSI